MKLLTLILCLVMLCTSCPAMAADESAAPPSTTADLPATTKTDAAKVLIGTVDFPMVAEKSEAGVKALAELKATYEKFQKTLKKKEQELEKLKNSLMEKGLTAEKRAAKEKLFQRKFGEYQKYGVEAQKEFAEKQANIGLKIKDELDRLVKDYGHDHGYAVILNKEGLVYNDSSYEILDLTEEILKLVNSKESK